LINSKKQQAKKLKGYAIKNVMKIVEKEGRYSEKNRILGMRIGEIREALNLKQKEFAESLNLSYSYYNQIENGNGNPGLDFFYNLIEKYHVNMEYLFHGTGKMFLGEEKDRILEGGNLQPAMSMDDLAWYMEHSAIVKHMLLDYANSILRDNKDAILRNLEWSLALDKPYE